MRTVRRVLADGTVREYRYPRKPPKEAAFRYEQGTVAAVQAAYEHSPEWRALSEVTQRTKLIYLRDLRDFGPLPIKSLSRRMILSVRDAIAATRGNGAGTGFTRTASAFLAWAVSRDWLDHNPLAGARALPGGHLPAWSRAQVEHAMHALSEPYRRVVVLAFYTGQRRGDLIRLSWSAYDGATIRLRQGKTGAQLVIPVHPALRVELDAWRRTAASTLILTAPRGRPWTAEHLSREMPKALAEIGIGGVNVHGLRKLAAATLAEAGASANEIAAITGHRTLSMIQLYTASADQERLARAAIVRLSDHEGRRRENAGKRRK